MSEPAGIRVDLAAVEQNLRVFAERVSVPVIAVVKANGYGHGMVPVAQAALAGGACALGVAGLDEAVRLRAAGVCAPIIAWLDAPSWQWEQVLAAQIQPALSSLQHLQMFAETLERDRPGQEPWPVHIKLDTGLGRNGVREDDWRAVFALLRDLIDRDIVRFEGLMSHFSGTSRADDLAQIAAFERALAAARAAGVQPRVRHFAASAAALELPQARYDAVRFGIGLYGLDPLAPEGNCGLALQPALTMTAGVSHSGEGETARWLVDAGQVDGLLPARDLTLTDEVGGRWRLESVDATHCAITPMSHKPGEAPRRITVIGASASADDWAAAAGTIHYEITTRLNDRVPREYSGMQPAPTQPHTETFGAASRSSAPGAGALAQLRINTAQLAAGVRELAASGIPLDVTADAYGLGLSQLRERIDLGGINLVVRREYEQFRLRELGIHASFDPDAGPQTRIPYGFTPGCAVTELRSELTQIKRVAAGQGVSYGYQWRASTPTTLGLVACGYADVIARAATGRARVNLHGGQAPIVGRVAMDQVVLDLGEREIAPAAQVRLWGGQPGDPTLNDWARWCGLSIEGMLASVGNRVKRVWQEA